MSGKRKRLREKQKEASAKYYQKHKEELKEKYENNKEEINKKRKPWIEKNKDKLKDYAAKYYKQNKKDIIKDQVERNKLNPNFKDNVRKYTRENRQKMKVESYKRYVKNQLAKGKHPAKYIKIYDDHMRIASHTDFREISVDDKREMLDAISAFLNSGGDRIWPETEILEPSENDIKI